MIDIRNGKRLICFDNHHGKGYHFHRLGREFPYEFTDIWQLINDFYQEVEKVKWRL
ncbi:peptidylprolyl isomerase [Candidatus Woesearchaeota archaeon]|nr:peptidylprolyl isomerase [Candidatus Woesearchaeota archaeon]